jgi:hypothetical protein
MTCNIVLGFCVLGELGGAVGVAVVVRSGEALFLLSGTKVLAEVVVEVFLFFW